MKPEKKKMNHCIREPNKNLLFLVRDPVLTTVSATTAYAGKMLSVTQIYKLGDGNLACSVTVS